MKKIFLSAVSATFLLSTISFASVEDDSSNLVGNLEIDVYSLEKKLDAEGISYSQVAEVTGTGYFLQEKGLERRYGELKDLLEKSKES